MSESNKLEVSQPIAIIIAGIIVAGAIVYANAHPARPAPAEAGQQAQPGLQGQMSPALYQKLAVQFGAHAATYASCVAQQTYQHKIDTDAAEAQALGAGGTPYTVVFDTKTKHTVSVSGALPYEQIQAAIAKVATADEHLALRPPSADDHIVGSPSAPIVLIEYSDFQCPFCQMIYPTLTRIVGESGGKVAWVYRQFPLTGLHPQAAPAAGASECIAAQLGNAGFWKFADAIFGGQ